MNNPKKGKKNKKEGRRMSVAGEFVDWQVWPNPVPGLILPSYKYPTLETFVRGNRKEMADPRIKLKVILYGPEK